MRVSFWSPSSAATRFNQTHPASPGFGRAYVIAGSRLRRFYDRQGHLDVAQGEALVKAVLNLIGDQEPHYRNNPARITKDFQQADAWLLADDMTLFSPYSKPPNWPDAFGYIYVMTNTHEPTMDEVKRPQGRLPSPMQAYTQKDPTPMMHWFAQAKAAGKLHVVG
ncbi:MAG: hypothetical protein R2857_11125 [Vampirovibrionales bacterium]